MQTPLRLLHLEDNPQDAKLVHLELDKGGLRCEVTLAGTKEQFLSALEKGGFDLVLLDYAVPGFDGISALKMARATWPDVPILFVSGTLGEDAAIETMREGATDYVLKSNLSRLVPAVHRALREVQHRAERQRIERKLGQSIALLQALFQSAPVAISMLDPQGRVLLWGAGAEQLFGWTGDEVTGRTLPTVPQDRQEEFYVVLRAVVMGQVLTGLQTQARRKDGETVFVSLFAAPVYEADGRVAGVVRIEIDITARERAEEDLKASERKYRALFQDSIQPLCLITDGKIADVNSAWLKMVGYENPAEVIGREFATFTHPDDRAVLDLWRTAPDKDLAHPHRLHLIRKDGSTLKLLASACTVLAGEAPSLLITICRVEA